MGVDSLIQHVNIDMPAKDVDRQVMEREPVGKVIEEEKFGMRPRYLQYNLWTPDPDPMITAAEWTLSAQLLPRPSQNKFENSLAVETIQNNVSLFEVVTSIKIDVLHVTTSTDSGFTAVTGASQYLIMPKHMSKELAEPMNINWKTSSIHRFENG